jgi:bacterioferritin-associated ferredoxin
VLECSFCGRSRDKVRQLVTGPQAAICDRCVHAGLHPPDPGPEVECSFCREPSTLQSLRGEHGAAMCPTCVELAYEVIREAKATPLPRAIVRPKA